MALKMVSEGVCATKEEALGIIDGSTQNASVSGKTGGASTGDQSQWFVAGSQGNDKMDSFGRSDGGIRGIGGGLKGIGGSDSSGGGPQIMYKDHPVYGKYFKMIKAGLPDVAVKAKMDADGIDSSVLSRNPTDFIIPKGGSVLGKLEVDKIEIQNHPKYQKYFTMLKVGLPRIAIQAKMQEDGVDPSKLDVDPRELIPTAETEAKKSAETVSLLEHPKYAKYFKMMKVGLAKEAVQAKMIQEGLDPSILDKDPNDKIPVSDISDSAPDEMVALKDHPKYSKYFKMLKVGLPRPQVEAKMKQENMDPAILDRNPTELVAENEEIAVVTKVPEIKKKPVEKVRKKKLHWKALEKVEADSVWATGEDDKDDFNLDMDEFQVLFSEKKYSIVYKP